MSIAAGEYVTPNIRLVRKLGAGGMGSVWVAEHLALSTEVVVKFMATELMIHVEVAARFRREAAAAAQVKSPHVVQMLDHGVTSDGIPFIVMEMLNGHDLGKELEDKGTLPPKDVAIITKQVAKALSKAHDSGIVHRDIKPDNVFLCDDSEGFFVKLLDFGIAKSAAGAIKDPTQTGLMIGTPPYMSPEQLRGAKDLDFRSDLWSLGVLVYEALTGQRPFKGEGVADLAIAIHTTESAPPSSVKPSLPPGLDSWFARACAKDPERRFQSAKEFADSLERAVAGLAPRPELDATLPMGIASAPPPRAATSVSTDAGMGNTAYPLPKKSSSLAIFVGGIASVAVVILGIVGVSRIVRSPDTKVALSAPLAPAVSAPPAATSIASLVESAAAPLPLAAPSPTAATKAFSKGHPHDAGALAVTPVVPPAPPSAPAPATAAPSPSSKYRDIR